MGKAPAPPSGMGKAPAPPSGMGKAPAPPAPAPAPKVGSSKPVKWGGGAPGGDRGDLLSAIQAGKKLKKSKPKKKSASKKPKKKVLSMQEEMALRMAKRNKG